MTSTPNSAERLAALRRGIDRAARLHAWPLCARLAAAAAAMAEADRLAALAAAEADRTPAAHRAWQAAADTAATLRRMADDAAEAARVMGAAR